jgi:phosphatidate cytidylyltransferase
MQNLRQNPNIAPDAPNAPDTSHAARLVTAAIGIPLVLAVVWLGGVAFALVVGVLALVGMRELELAHRKASTPLAAFLAYPALLLILGLAADYALTGELANPSAPTLFFTLWLLPVTLLVLGVLAYGARGKVSLISIALTNFVVLYVGLFAFLILLRGLPRGGLHLFWVVLLGVWAGDSFAYFGGRKWGRTPLSSLSPKKTREGTAIGVLASLLLCTALAVWFGFGVAHGLALGVLVALAAPLGDLAESFWKRELGIKDLGALLPGHGGVLDRCDSLLFAAFVVYLYELWRI